MKQTISFACLFALLSAFLDWTVVRYFDGLVFGSVDGFPPAAVPFWLSMPRALFFLAVGATYALLPMGRRQVAGSAALYVGLVAIYYYFARVGSEWWVAPDVYAYSVAFLPFLAIPMFFAIGLIAVRKLRRQPAADA